MHDHEIEIIWRRRNMTGALSCPDGYGAAHAEGDSTDLTEAWRQALAMMPPPLYAALKAAMPADDGNR